MYRIIKIFTVISLGILIVIAACSKNDTTVASNIKATETKKNFHGESTEKGTTTPLADNLKEKKLNLFLGKTVGEVFDSYKFAAKKEWRESEPKSGTHYIDYICLLNTSPRSSTAQMDDGLQRLVDIKFAIKENGEAYIALATIIVIEKDGKTTTTHYQSDEAILKIVKAIYANKEIAL